MAKTDSTTSQDRRRADGSANIALLHEVWRQAYLSPEPMRIPCDSAADANSLRTKLYNAVRNVKKYPHEYPGLVDPVNEVEIVKEGLRDHIIVLRKKLLSPQMQKLKGVLAARGVVIEENSLKGTPQSRELAQSMDRLLTELGASSEPVSDPSPAIPPPITPLPGGHNPFFSREQQ